MVITWVDDEGEDEDTDWEGDEDEAEMSSWVNEWSAAGKKEMRWAGSSYVLHVTHCNIVTHCVSVLDTF